MTRAYFKEKNDRNQIISKLNVCRRKEGKKRTKQKSDGFKRCSSFDSYIDNNRIIPLKWDYITHYYYYYYEKYWLPSQKYTRSATVR